jgi:hypothetical protein
MSVLNQEAKSVVLIDARGPRYTASLTTFVLSLALITESNYIIGFQFTVFLSAVLFGLLILFIHNKFEKQLSEEIEENNEIE